MKTNKEKGRAGLSVAIAYYGCSGFTISLPLNDTQDYDLIVDNGEQLQKVQVKCTGNIQNSGCYSVSLRSCGGTNGQVYKRIIDTNIDALFILCTNGWMFHIPIKELKNTNSIAVGDLKTNSSYAKFMVSIPFIEPIEVTHTYPKKKLPNTCVDCGAPIKKESTRCLQCEKKRRETAHALTSKCPSKEKLLQDILALPLTQVGLKYDVSDNTIRKWCKKLNLPYTRDSIQKFKIPNNI